MISETWVVVLDALTYAGNLGAIRSLLQLFRIQDRIMRTPDKMLLSMSLFKYSVHILTQHAYFIFIYK